MVIGRRGLVASVGAGLALPATLVKAQASSTPEQILGPFYPIVQPADSDADLTRVAGRAGQAKGPAYVLTGRVVRSNGQPISGASIEMWQANAGGRYDHPSDTSSVPLDPDFQGFARLTTDKEGRFRILSVVPGAYKTPGGGTRTPHLHFQVSSSTDRLVTQMYFPGEALNGQDILYGMMGKRADALVARAVDAPQPGVRGLDWTIII
jgi:protocatechuate 3,4-dioxygenase, beta subunit